MATNAAERQRARLGWAKTHTERHGRRQRTVYEITGDGHAALRTWFATPTRDPQLEFEALLRLLFANSARQLLDDGIQRLLRP